MARLRQNPPRSFRDRVETFELDLRGGHARAFEFVGGTRDIGRGVVCVAGMGADGRSFARQRALAGERFVLSLNLPTETPPDRDPLQFATANLEEVVALERLVRPVLIGSSFGGAVSALAAIRNPTGYRALILVGAVLSRWQIPLAFPGFVDLLEAPRPIANVVAPIAAQIMGGLALDRDARDELVREARHFTGRELKRRLESLLDLDLVPELENIPLPVLFIHGRRDLLVPWRRAALTAQKIYGARFELVHGAGHLPYLSHPEEFNACVSKFLDEVEAADGIESAHA